MLTLQRGGAAGEVLRGRSVVTARRRQKLRVLQVRWRAAEGRPVSGGSPTASAVGGRRLFPGQG